MSFWQPEPLPSSSFHSRFASVSYLVGWPAGPLQLVEVFGCSLHGCHFLVLVVPTLRATGTFGMLAYHCLLHKSGLVAPSMGEFWMKRTFQRTVLARPWLTFLVMGGSFGLFGAGTLNIFSMFSSNWDMLTQHGALAMATASLWQLIELLATLFLSMFFYTIFKTCEHALVGYFTDIRHTDNHN